MHILLTVPHTFLMKLVIFLTSEKIPGNSEKILISSKENLSKYQDILSLVITFFILITLTFEQVVIMSREISFL